MKKQINLERFSGGLNMVRDSLRGLMPTGEKPSRKIEVQQRGLATGQIIFVRVIRRTHIPVKYVESN